VTALPTPLLSFQLYHRSMRHGARQLVGDLATDGVEARRAAISRWFERFREACLIHAEGEDAVLWVALLDRRTDLAPVVSAMEREHAELSGLLDQVATCLAGSDGLDVARDLAARLVAVLEQHLDDEEHVAVPALVAAMPDDVAELMRRVQASAGPRGAAVALPFLLEHADDEERAAVLDVLPPPVRAELESSWEPAYRELVAAAAPHAR
jgi:hypothetical protein